jgi:hypothetical protein
VSERFGVARHRRDGHVVGRNLWQRPSERRRTRGGDVDGRRLLRPECRRRFVVRPETSCLDGL